MGGCGSNSDGNETKVSESGVEYRVLEISSDEMERHVIDLIVDDEVNEETWTPNHQIDIHDMLEEIVTDYTAEHEVTALTVTIYGSEDDRTHGIFRGYCKYYPEGDYDKSSQVKPGDYTTFQAEYDLNYWRSTKLPPD
ncbi:MAG: hypothetical protein U0M15_05430 [Bacillota bacterium]|nr:hypothetical protein [Bacillota bacterium]